MKRIGDRKDGTLIRDLDGMHFITPVIYPNRCDNEAFISEIIDLSKTNEYLKQKNADNPDYKYNLFQIIVTAILKVVYQRDKLNRFIVSKRFYQRNYLSASFVVKKEFADEGGEALAFLYAKEDDNIDTIHEAIKKEVRMGHSEQKDASTASMDILNRIPHFISYGLIWALTRLDKRGKVPHSLIASDPYYSSVVLSNLGSIKLHSGYHHLTNWGTNSLFCAIGEIKKRPFYHDDGSFEMKDSVDLGLTIDERLADGYYYSRSIKMLKTLIENPQLLELPFKTVVDLSGCEEK